MKKIFFFSLMFIFCCACYPQIIVSSMLFGNARIAGNSFIAQKEIDYLKTTKTYFVVPDAEADDLDAINQMLQNVWNFTKIEAVTASGVSQIKDTKVSFFNIMGVMTDEMYYIVMRLSSSVTKTNPLFSSSSDKMYAYFYLSTDQKNMTQMRLLYEKTSANVFGKKLQDESVSQKEIVDFLYNKNNYYNFYLGHISCYLARINSALSNPKGQMFGTAGVLKTEKPLELQNLKKDTLFIPDWLLTQQKWGFGTVKEEKVGKSDLMAGYTYKYKILPAADIDDKILNSSDAIYYLDYFTTSLFSIALILNSKTGEVVYSADIPRTYISNKDIKELVVKINGK